MRPFFPKSAWLAVVASAVLDLGAAVTARADDDHDTPVSDTDSARHAIDRTWLYADDARVPAPLLVVGTTSLSYTSVGNSPSRIVSPFDGCTAPCNKYKSFAANTATPGGMLDSGAEVGLLPRLSLVAIGQVGLGGSDNTPTPSAGIVAGLRLQAFPSEWSNAHLVVSAGYLREAWQGPVYDAEADLWHAGSPNGDNGAWIQVAFSADIERLRLATTAHGEHVFSDGRDALDVMVQAGASYRLVDDFRAGVEYVGQDLEETFSAGAEGIPRHFLGPIASLQLLNKRLTIVGGPAVGLNSSSPDFIGRVAVSSSF